MTSIVRNYVVPKMTEKIVSFRENEEISFEDAVAKKLSKYQGLTETELIKMFSLQSKINSKNKFERITAAMLGIKGRINDTDEFSKANILCKTIRVMYNNTIEQHMSFPAFEFEKIYEET